MSHSITGKVAIVTGAGNGIGRAIAQRFAASGARVVVNDVNEDAVDETVKTITGAGHSALGFVADVSNAEQVKTMIDGVMTAHAQIDVLVNNAGLTGPMLHFFEADEAWWRRIIDTNTSD